VTLVFLEPCKRIRRRPARVRDHWNSAVYECRAQRRAAFIHRHHLVVGPPPTPRARDSARWRWRRARRAAATSAGSGRSRRLRLELSAPATARPPTATRPRRTTEYRCPDRRRTTEEAEEFTGKITAIADSPSDRRSLGFLGGYCPRPGHADESTSLTWGGGKGLVCRYRCGGLRPHLAPLLCA